MLRDWTLRLPIGAVVAEPHPAARFTREALVRFALAERRRWQPRIHAILTIRAPRPPVKPLIFPAWNTPPPISDARLARFARLRNQSLALLRDMQPTPDWFLVHWVRPDADPAALTQLLDEWVASETALLRRLACMLAHRNALVAHRLHATSPWPGSEETSRPPNLSSSAPAEITHL